MRDRDRIGAFVANGRLCSGSGIEGTLWGPRGPKKLNVWASRGHLDLCFIIYTGKEPISHRPASIIICMYAITELNSTHISSDFVSRSKEVIKLVIICNIIDFHLLFKESYHPLSHFTLLPPLSPLLPLLLWKWPRFVYSDAVHR